MAPLQWSKSDPFNVEMGLGCVKTQKRSDAIEQKLRKVSFNSKRFADESDFALFEKNHSRHFSIFRVFTQPGSIATDAVELACRLMSASLRKRKLARSSKHARVLDFRNSAGSSRCWPPCDALDLNSRECTALL